MKRIAITGQTGFMGTHLYNYLHFVRKDYELIPFESRFFKDRSRLQDICRNADVIFHLAALNRHKDPSEIYNVNMDLVHKLIDACEAAGSRPHVLFASSTQEMKDNPYAKSKRDGRKLLEKWARGNQARFTAMIIPNVFGPFGVPHHNSVISTFCHQIVSDEQPRIEVDAKLNLIYVNDLVEKLREAMEYDPVLSDDQTIRIYEVPGQTGQRVSRILATLRRFKSDYLDGGSIPELTSDFEVNLFNTLRCYVPKDRFPRPLAEHSDQRGVFVEIMKAHVPGQFSYSTTNPGNTRGNHFHTRKLERFIVVKGKARIELRRVGSDEAVGYELDGRRPSFVDMPVWHTHNITNVGRDELVTLFWTNEHYDPLDPDTYYERV